MSIPGARWRSRITLARTVALAVCIAFATGAHADNTGEQIAQLQAQLKALKQQLDVLQAAYDRQAAQVAPEATVAAPAKPAPTPVKAWSDSTQVGGKAFIDLSHVDQSSNGIDTDARGYGIDVKRFYLAVDHRFDDRYSVNLTSDFNYVSADAETQVFIKKAYVQAKFSDSAILRVGAADMPWIPFVESLYGYRYVEATVSDRNRFANSADWGVNLSGGYGKWLSYSLSLVNGGGFRNPTRSDGVDLEARVGVQPVEGLTLALGGYRGERGLDVHSNPARRYATRIDVLAAYNGGNWRLGAEWFQADNWNTVRGTVTDQADGSSFWGSAGVAKDVNLFARYDRVSPKTELDPSLHDEFVDFGVEWVLLKGIKISGVYKHELLRNGRAGAARVDTRTDEIGAFAEVVF